MFKDFPLFPEAASSYARDVDQLYLFLVAISGFMTLFIAFLVIFLAVKYRRRPGNMTSSKEEAPKLLEIVWIVIPFFVFMGIFVWGAKVYFTIYQIPKSGIEVNVTGKQWMWRFQHMGGQSEINHLHVPVGKPVILTMISEDVIHSLYIPDFRLKVDVLPNRYRKGWFTATKVGTYHLFCAEYCGTQHSGMIGYVTVMEPAAYQQWLNGGETEGAPAAEGKKLFDKLACSTCHTEAAGARGPILTGLYGSTVRLRGGGTVVADDGYIRESILNSQAKVVEGFDPIMPTFQGQVNESQVMQLIAYIKSLSPQKPAMPTTVSPQAAATSSGALTNVPAPQTGVETGKQQGTASQGNGRTQQQ